MIEAVGDDGVAFAQQWLEKPAVGIETGGVQDRILAADIAGDAFLEGKVQVGGATDEPHRGHAEAVAVEHRLGGGNQLRVVGKAQVIVGAQVQHRTSRAVRAHPYVAGLCRHERTLGLPQVLVADGLKLGRNIVKNARHCHRHQRAPDKCPMTRLLT